MKTSHLFPISFLILFLSSPPSLLISTAEQPDPVVDITGNQLRTGISYYILPVFRGRGGGVTLGRGLSNDTCPLDVVQDQYELNPGLPLKFTPVNPKKGVIRVSTDLNIRFDAATTCVQSTVWRILESSPGQYVISSNGVEGNPGIQTISNWFKIEKDDKDYKLLYCPTVCNYCKVICRDVGIFIKDGVRRLALSDVPFKIMFKKA
ncbi:protease inhibitor [Lithospermum erythrorhizon]|uniref:Protease inhibitor n=1 Tax=Lithospermum erythrorhizon TaxID=34254 RepID=A0AAV3Q390_LITER